MISNQVLQNTLEGLKEISRTEFCVVDVDGKVLASTFADFAISSGDVQAFVESPAESQLVKGFQYFKVCDDYQLEYVLVAHGDDEDTYMVGKLAAFQIQNLIVAYKERFDKDSFIKNLLLDNLLLVDIYNRAKKLHIEADVRRVVMIHEMPKEKDHSSMESVKSLFGGKSKDFIERSLAGCATRDKGNLTEAALSGQDAVLSYLEMTDFKEGAEQFRESTSKFEKWCDDLLMECVSEAKYTPFGVEPIVAYYVARDAEVKTARIILSAKKNNLSADMIRERVRTLYV